MNSLKGGIRPSLDTEVLGYHQIWWNRSEEDQKGYCHFWELECINGPPMAAKSYLIGKHK